MEQLINKKYKLSYPSEHKLIKAGFRRVKTYDKEVWKHCFPVYKYNHKITTIECVLHVELPSGRVSIDVYSNGHFFAPFYNNEYGNYEPIIEIVNNNILREFSKLGIKEKRKKK